VVGKLRQLDVGVIDAASGEAKVHALVEVQKRKAKVGLEDFGSWIYKRDTLQARELVIVSEMGFTKPVIAHVKKLHPNTVRLGILHGAETGFIERINSTCLGMVRVLDLWWFASIFVQYADADEIETLDLKDLDTEASIFGTASPMSLIRHCEMVVGAFPAGWRNLNIETASELSYRSRPLKRILITAEKQRRIWEPRTQYYGYDEVHPNPMQKGIAIVSAFRLDASRYGKMKLVISPDLDNANGGNARLAGQFEFT
jgi:hypothetical protein